MDTMKLPEWANWIVRDNDGQLLVYEEMPRRGKWAPWWDRIGKISTLDSDLYPEVTWEDEGPTYLGPALELDEQEKVVVPQFVADWYEDKKDFLELELFGLVIQTYEKIDGTHTDIEDYFDHSSNKPFETLIKMKLFGYEVEKEKLYYVLDKSNESMLIKVFGDVKKSAGIKMDGTFSTVPYMFTEKEIKDYDPRYWPFVVEVAE